MTPRSFRPSSSSATRPSPSSPALRHRPPATCTSAGHARRCSTGSMPATRAGSSCCASRTPTASARPSQPSPRSSTASRWLELEWDGEPLYISSERAAAPSRGCIAATRRRARPTAATPARRNWSEMREKAQRRRQVPRSTTACWRDRDPKEAPAGVKPVVRPQAADSKARPSSRMPCMGRVVLAERRSRRHDHPQERRHAGL